MNDPTIRFRRPEPRRSGFSDRCWTCWMLGLLLLALVFVSAANTILLWNLNDHVKVVRVERTVP